MSAVVPIPVHLYMSVGNSPVMNELGSVDMQLEVEPITDENRQEGDALEAKGRVLNFDLPAALRQFADEIDRVRAEEQTNP